MELLIISLLSFSMGWGTYWMNDEETVCKEIVLSIPQEAVEPIAIKDCIEHDSKEVCNVGYPRAVLHTEEYKKDIGHGIITRESLKQCVDAVDRYNFNKSITR